MVIELFITMERYRKNRPIFKHIKRTLGGVNLNTEYVLPNLAVRIQVSPDCLQVSEKYFVMVFKKHDLPITSGRDCLFLNIPLHSIIDAKMILWKTV